MALDRTGGLGHLHQREGSLLHARAAGDGIAHHRQVVCCGMFKQPCDFFTHYGAHTAHHEIGLHDKERAEMTADFSSATEDGLVFMGGGFHVGQFFLIAGEVDNIMAPHVLVHGDIGSGITDKADSLTRAHAEMVTTFTGVVMIPKFREWNMLAAVGALLGQLHIVGGGGHPACARPFPARFWAAGR